MARLAALGSQPRLLPLHAILHTRPPFSANCSREPKQPQGSLQTPVGGMVQGLMLREAWQLSSSRVDDILQRKMKESVEMTSV